MRCHSGRSALARLAQAKYRQAILQGITKYRVIPGSGCFREQLADGKPATTFLAFPQDKLSHPVQASRCKPGRRPGAASDGEPPDNTTV